MWSLSEIWLSYVFQSNYTSTALEQHLGSHPVIPLHFPLEAPIKALSSQWKSFTVDTGYNIDERHLFDEQEFLCPSLPSSWKIRGSETENLSPPNAYTGSFTKKTKYRILLNWAFFLRLLVCYSSFWWLNNSCSNMKRLQKSTSHWKQRGYPMVLLCSLFHICLMKSSAFIK